MRGLGSGTIRGILGHMGGHSDFLSMILYGRFWDFEGKGKVIAEGLGLFLGFWGCLSKNYSSNTC